ncbi:MAG: hypothetical protein CBC13_02955 [Planctomycetia bacterium TMED53]|nr:MAG: hypothetical protein CBC13_02955 [Planctomycetia bacterium TMED53]
MNDKTRRLAMVFIVMGVLQSPFFASLDAQEDGAGTTEISASTLKDLISEDPQKSKAAIQLIREAKDPSLLDDLAPLLDSPEGRSRQIVTMLVLGVYPDLAHQFFKQASQRPAAPAREAAMYGLARIPSAVVVEDLVNGLKDQEKVVRTAALRGMQLICRPDSSVLFPALLTAETSQIPNLHPGSAAVQQFLGGSLEPSFRTELKGIWHETSTHQTLTKIQNDFAGNFKNEDTERALQKIFNSSRGWTGKPTTDQDLSYTFSMVNLASGSTKEISIEATPKESSLVRQLDYHLDRGVHLRLIADLWLQAPHLYTLSISIEKNSVLVEVDMAGAPSLHAGVGLLNIAYWQGRVATCSKATLKFNSSNGRFISEKGFDANSKLVWSAAVGSWLTTDQPSTTKDFPESIQVLMPEGQVGARKYHLDFNAIFKISQGQWHLSKAEMNEWVPDSSGKKESSLKAIAELDFKSQ